MKNNILFRGLLSLLCIFLFGACAPTVSQRGNMVEDFQIEQVKAGIHTKTDVLRILGSPTVEAPFKENKWYYIGQTAEKRGVLDPEITEERIVAVTFDKQNTVLSVDDVETERTDLPVSRDATPTHGNDITVLQQLIGNLGRFNTQSIEK